MKKTVLALLAFTCFLFFASCGKKASPIVLPAPEKLVSIDVTAGEITHTFEDPQWIRKVLEGISSSQPTRKQSISDEPRQEEYLKLDLRQQAGASTLFAYEEKGKFYIEQPYEGIYEIDQALYQLIVTGP